MVTAKTDILPHLDDYYEVLELIAETHNSILYKGIDANNNILTIKTLNVEHPSNTDIARFKQEHELIKDLDLPGIIKTYDIGNFMGQPAIIQEYFEGSPLKQLINKKRGIKWFLDISIQLAETLGELHKNHIVHKDIKPSNLLVKDNFVKISDFGISTDLTQVNENIFDSEVIKGTLPYTSPEQTSRIKKPIDYRTDLYSLGVTFYEMLTNLCPFRSKDPLELIHSHLALIPEPPQALNSSIPEVISEIIMKLLNKAAEERYQNSFGLAADLKECKKRITENEEIESFELGLSDTSLEFNVPHKLIGREDEIDSLMSVFEKVSLGYSDLLLVYGHPGIGKSALINEIHRPIVAKRGFFIAGKYEQFKKNIPYNAIINAFQGLIQQILTRSDEDIEHWKEKLLEALGDNGKVITDVIPELEHIIGTQPEVPELSAQAAQNRFIFVFKNFLNTFPSKEHPLVISLDDLQWVDSASLYLIKSILTDKKIHYLFMILSFRDNEIDNNHIFYHTIEEIKNSGLKTNEIEVKPLNLNNTYKFISNFFKSDQNSIHSLSRIVYEKTDGNPFFIIQFMKAIHERKFIYQEPDSGWKININAIKQMNVTDNVIDLLTKKITKLPENTQKVLKDCSCIGNSFDLEALNKYINLPLETILEEIKKAVAENFIDLQNNIYRFNHDRIQEAAYSLIPLEEKEQMHYLIGRTELNNTTDKELNEKVHYIVNQLNLGRRLISSRDELLRLTELNLFAGKKAIDSSAFESAYHYLMTAVDLFEENEFNNNHDLALDIYNEAAQAAYLNSDYELMENLCEKIMQKTNDISKYLDLYEIKMRAFMAKGQKSEAVHTALSIFDKLNLRFPEHPKKYHLINALLKLKIAMAGKNVEELTDLPLMKDPEVQKRIKMLGYFSPIAYWARPEAVPLISFLGVYYTVKYGLSSMSPLMLAGYGIASSSMGNYQLSYKLGKVAQEIAEKIEAKNIAPRTEFIYLTWIKHWKDNQHEIPRLLLENHQKAMEVGDIEFAAHALMVHSYHSFYSGIPLDTVEKHIMKNIETLKYLQQYSQLNLTRIYGQTVQNLLNKSNDPTSLIGDIYNEEEMLPFHERSEDQFAVHSVHAFNLILNYFFRNLEKAKKSSENYLKNLGSSAKGVMTYVICNFFDSLTRLGLYNLVSEKEQKKILNRVGKNQKNMQKWAKMNSQNFLQKYYLVEAELARINDQRYKAIEYFNLAISMSKENQYIQDEALSNELAARCWLEFNNESYAKFHIKQAISCYNSWGASAKVKQLNKEFSKLISKANFIKDYDIGKNALHKSDDTQSLVETMDMTAVIKSTQALSSEIVLENLLEKIMKIAIEYAGAQRGIMLIETNEKFYIEVERDANGNVEVLKSIPVENYDKCATSILSYVIKTRESVVLNNANEDDRYFNDPYVKENNTKSILCTPIQNKGLTAAIVYLENNYIANVFMPERLEILRILFSQAAISIENAKLYRMAITDDLTGLFTHKHFYFHLDKEVERSLRYGCIFSLVMFDIDHFKEINDTYGHQAGDSILIEVSNKARTEFRSADVITRYGGEEFVIILTETDSEGAIVAAERFRKNIKDTIFYYDNLEINLTISFGIAEFPLHAKDAKTILKLVDDALYTSKKSGRNTVCVAK